MLQTCLSCSTTVDVDPARPLPPGAKSWACPKCRTALPPLVASAGPVPAAAAATTPAPAAPSTDMSQVVMAQVRKEIAAVREELLARLASATGGTVPMSGMAGTTGTPVTPGPSGGGRDATALVCSNDPALASALRNAVAGMGYAPETVTDVRSAALRLVQSDPVVVVIDLGIGADPQEGLSLLEQVGRLPGHRRRATFVACVAASLRTLDHAAAFACGADVTLCSTEPEGFSEALIEGMAGRDDLYRVFHEVLEGVQG